MYTQVYISTYSVRICMCIYIYIYIYIYLVTPSPRAYLSTVCMKEIYLQMFSVHLVCRCLAENTVFLRCFGAMFDIVPDVISVLDAKQDSRKQ